MFRYRLTTLLLAATLTLFPAIADQSPRAQGTRPLKLVVLGDSLSSGFLIRQSQALPAVLEESLRAQGRNVTVIDAAVTNDPSWGGLERLDRDVPPDTDGVILELGANDMIRMVNPGVTRNALDQIIARLQARGVRVLLVGFRMPIPWGHDAAGFEAMYRSLAGRYHLTYHPDIYAGLSDHPGYRLLDHIHPSPEGVQLVVSKMLPLVSRFVTDLGKQSVATAHRINR